MHPDDVKAIDAYTEIVRREAAKDAEIARLQEQVETLRKELASEKISASAWADSARINLHRAEAAEAERDRLRADNARMTEALQEAEGELYQVPPADAEQERVLAIVRAALQKEPQP